MAHFTPLPKPVSYAGNKPLSTSNIQKLKTQQSSFKQSAQLPSLNPEDNYGRSEVYKTIVQLNRNFLAEKVRVNEVRRPHRYEHKLPTKTGVSEYNRKYSTGKRAYSLAGSNPENDPSGSRMKMPNSQITNLQSSYRVDYSNDRNHQVLPSVISSNNKRNEVVQRDERPFFKQSAYQRDFQFRGFISSQGSKQTESIALGGRFCGDTTYNVNFRAKNNLKTLPSEPILPRQHKIFTKIEDPGVSNYQQNYGNKQGEVEASFKPQNKYASYFKSIGLNTEYKKAYAQKLHTQNSDFDCLNQEQLHQYVMSSSKK